MRVTSDDDSKLAQISRSAVFRDTRLSAWNATNESVAVFLQAFERHMQALCFAP